ncbi:MAG: hypothetical protein JJT94_01520 [Bernardetiaceae bacterium]|nr:hypothetical protein [Bernardetiaceae bacterium]
MRLHYYALFLILICLFSACKKEEEQLADKATLTASSTMLSWENLPEGRISESKTLQLEGNHFTTSAVLQSSAGFIISRDNVSFSDRVNLSSEELNAGLNIFVQCDAREQRPSLLEGQLILESNELATAFEVNLQAKVIPYSEPILHFDTEGLALLRSEAGRHSRTQTFSISSENLSGSLLLQSSISFPISLDNQNFSRELTLDANEVNREPRVIYVRFSPSANAEAGLQTASIGAEASGIARQELRIEGEVVGTETFNYQAFESEHLAFGEGLSQRKTQTFSLHPDVSQVSQIDMYIKLRCPSGGCNAWDVYANILAKDPTTGTFYEIGRYITPYGVGNQQRERGFKIDVTDFKSVLEGQVELQSFIEVWGSDGWLLSVDFDFTEGLPDYAYTEIAPIVQYNAHSLQIPYGKDASHFDLQKTVAIPNQVEKTYLRTIITGWGHATPNDPDGRPCAEWCFRTHHIHVNGSALFTHDLAPIGCGSNPVRPQGGNWRPDRAGWCPGMEVPLRIDYFAENMAGSQFGYEYVFENWRNNNGNGDAFYALSSFVVVKSDTPIEKPTVRE